MNYFVTTSIPYVNAEPHIGFALELLQADVLARAARAQGKPVIFSTGTDEHGGKIEEKAAENNMTPKEFADKVSQSFRDMAKLLDVSNDRFIRTTDAGHEQRAQLIWKALQKDIYKGKYVGWYCTGDEAFFTEAVVKENNGICPNHNRKYEKVEEENYFFKLSAYAPQIEKAINDGSFRIIPATRKHEIMQVIKDGLDDVSISRPKDKIGWGIPVPGDSKQVMYVWVEALMNYITVLGYPEHQDFKDFWPANVQVIGKDIIRFHAAIWPGILLALGFPLAKTLYVHGFITVEGKKMSKTLGNVIHPRELVEEYGVDAVRYYFLRHMPAYDDGDFSHDRFLDAYNNELANELGNAVQRTAAMIKQYQDGLIGDIPAAEHDVAQYWQAIEDCRFDRALDEVWEQVRGLNQYIDEQKPWVLNKNGDMEHLKEVLSYQASCLIEIADLLAPFMPSTAQKIKFVFEEGLIKPIEGTLFAQSVEDRIMDHKSGVASAQLLEFTDSHCHIHEADPRYDDETESRTRWLKAGVHDADELVRVANTNGVTRMVCIGTTLADSKHAIDFAARHDGVFASIGLHPHEAANYANDEAKKTAFADLATLPKVVAVGECGLDYFYGLSPKVDQIAVLRFQIELAQANNLPMSFHVRAAFDDFWPVFDEYHTKRPVRGVLHSFTDSLENMRKALERGLYIGVNGIATFNKDEALKMVHKTIPKERILLETDAPFLTPVPYRGKICEPKHVVATAEFLSALRSESIQELSQATIFNSQELFEI